MEKVTVVIAGTSVVIETDAAIAALLKQLKEFFFGFLKPRGTAGARLTVSYNHRITLAKFPPFPQPLPQTNERETVNIIRHIEESYPLSESSLLIGFLNGVLAYNVHSRTGRICLFRSDGKNFILGSLHKLLFLFQAIILAEEGKLMLHGAGLKLESDGCLFLGMSGRGKTTVAGYVKRESVLSDDAPVITQDGGLFSMHASPFSQVDLFDGKAADHHLKRTPLTRLVFLNQASHLDLQPRHKRSALSELLRDHIHGFDCMDRELKTRAFRFCCDLCASVPAFDLYFQKNRQFLSLFGA
jgi:hypothetical protein